MSKKQEKIVSIPVRHHGENLLLEDVVAEREWDDVLEVLRVRRPHPQETLGHFDGGFHVEGTAPQHLAIEVVVGGQHEALLVVQWRREFQQLNIFVGDFYIRKWNLAALVTPIIPAA